MTIGAHALTLKGEDAWEFRACAVGGEKLHIALVADGHGGGLAARHCKKVVLDTLLAVMGSDASASSIRRAGTVAFTRAHGDVHKMTHTTAGTTLTVVIVNVSRYEVTALHVGDSVARMVPQHSATVALCADHRIETGLDEQERLRALGAKIARARDSYGKPGGPMRLWPGGVAQARAIGDRDVPFIEPRPHAFTVPLPPAGARILVASDGVWDALLPAHVDALVRSCPTSVAPALLAQLVCNCSLTQRHAFSNSGDKLPRDDTTCIAIYVRGEAPEPSSGGGAFGVLCGACCGGGGVAETEVQPSAPPPRPPRARDMAVPVSVELEEESI